MTKFELISKTVSIDGEDYKLHPLSGEYYSIIYSILRTINPDGKADVKEEDVQSKLTPELINDIHKVVFHTLKESYPDADINQLNKFASANLWKLYPVVIELNIKG